MNRSDLFECYRSPRGKVLQQLEAQFLRRAITVGCKQSILQIGSLGWESEYIDCSLYQRFVVLDREFKANNGAGQIIARSLALPVQSNSAEMVILPHMLEYEVNQHQTLREIERVLKPEGKLLILNFNPWNFWVRYKNTRFKSKKNLLMRSMISRGKILDWLKLLNFEVDVVAGFNFKSSCEVNGNIKNSPGAVAYAVKAIKRRYTLIPFAPVKFKRPRYAVVGAVESSIKLRKHG